MWDQLVAALEVECHECGASTAIKVDERLVYTIPEVARLLRVGDAVAYELVDAGDIPAVKVWSGGQQVVPHRARGIPAPVAPGAASLTQGLSSSALDVGVQRMVTGTLYANAPYRCCRGLAILAV